MSRSFWKQWNLGVLIALVVYPAMGLLALLEALGVTGDGEEGLTLALSLGCLLLLSGLVFGLAFTRFRPAVWHEPERFGRASARWAAALGAFAAWAAFLLWAASLLEAEESPWMVMGAALGGGGVLFLCARRRGGVAPHGYLRAPLGWALALAAALAVALVALILGAFLTWGKLIPDTPPEQGTLDTACVWLGVVAAGFSLRWLLGRGRVADLAGLDPLWRFLGTACALLFPGLPQMARGRALTRHALACLLGSAALFHMGFAAMNLGSGVATFDILEVIATPNISDAFPSLLNTSGVLDTDLTLVAEVSPQRLSLERLKPIWDPGALLAPGIHFWDTLLLCALLYLGLALWSLRDHLRERAARETGRAQP